MCLLGTGESGEQLGLKMDLSAAAGAVGTDALLSLDEGLLTLDLGALEAPAAAEAGANAPVPPPAIADAPSPEPPAAAHPLLAALGPAWHPAGSLPVSPPPAGAARAELGRVA